MLCLYFSLASPFLFLALFKNDRCLISLQKENRRLHTDNFLINLKTLLEKVNHSLAELKEIYFTSSPSGQTGLRVSLAFLTTLQVLNPKIKLYHINTLLLQAGSNNCLSLLTVDNQASKYQVAVYQKKRCLLDTQQVQKEELAGLKEQFKDFQIKKDFEGVDFLSHFQELKKDFALLKKITEINY